MAALREVRRYQKTTETLIPKLPFQRLVKDIVLNDLQAEKRIEVSTLMALQEATEAYLIQYLEDALLGTIHCKRVTLSAKDLYLIKAMRYRQNRL